MCGSPLCGGPGLVLGNPCHNSTDLGNPGEERDTEESEGGGLTFKVNLGIMKMLRGF